MSDARSMVLKVLLALILTPLALCAQAAPDSLAGRWVGYGDVVVSWTRARTLAADVVIAQDGSVTGTIGDAKLLNARLKRNRGRMASMMGWKTAYIIEGDLEGPLLGDEGLVRKSVRIPLNLGSGQLRGSVATNGKPYGGFDKETFVSKLTLSRRPR